MFLLFNHNCKAIFIPVPKLLYRIGKGTNRMVFYLLPHSFFGIGKDNAVADNTTADGRKQNRRVQIQLLSNMCANTQGTALAPAGSGR